MSMNVSVVQTDIVWEDKQRNLVNIEQMILPLFGNTDIVVLPEMFNSGFTMNADKNGEAPDGNTFKWMKEISARGNFGLCGSYIVNVNHTFFNRFVFVSPEADVYYDKRHLFSLADENRYFSRGTSRLIFNFRGIRISPFICYDLRFPVWSRNRNDYDLGIYVANWPEARISVWNTLIKARAIENQCYIAGSNRTGTDGSGIMYTGNSVIIDPRGEIIAEALSKECSITAELSMPDLIDFRAKFPVYNDADDFVINI